MTWDFNRAHFARLSQVSCQQVLVIFFLFLTRPINPTLEDVVMQAQYQQPFDYTHRVDLSAMQAIHGVRTISELYKMIEANKKEIEKAKFPQELNRLWTNEAQLINHLDLIEQ